MKWGLRGRGVAPFLYRFSLVVSAHHEREDIIKQVMEETGLNVWQVSGTVGALIKKAKKAEREAKRGEGVYP